MILKERNSSIELLRIILVCGVIVLHYIADNGQLLNQVIFGSINYYIIVALNSMFVCAVDTFILISGYFSCCKMEVSLRKAIQLISEVIIIQFVYTMVTAILAGEGISLATIFWGLLPRNYYVTLYVTLYIISPFINGFINKLSKENYKKLVVYLTVLFLFEPTIAVMIEGITGGSIYGISTIGIQGAQWGYTIITFIVLYIIGGYLRIYGSIWNRQLNFVIYLSSHAVLLVWKLVELRIGNSIAAENYMNPILVVNALAVFQIFLELRIKSRMINKAAVGVFTVFLLHNKWIPYFEVDRFINKNSVMLVVVFLGSVFAIFMICDLIGILYSAIEKKIFDRIENRIGFYYVSFKQ